MFLVAFLCCLVLSFGSANLEGPFLFFGPRSLDKYMRPALVPIGQDELVKLYGEQAAIVVFNNPDAPPLNRALYPRLQRMLEGLPLMVLPQSYLEVHPDYVTNDTQTMTLQGPSSERDAQMTETFARFEDIYGPGKVLGILGNSHSHASRSRFDWRSKRQADPEVTTSADEEKPTRVLPRDALYNATGPPGRGALLYSSRWPEIRWSDGKITILDTPVGEPTVKPTRLYTTLVVRFADGDTTNKITLEFNFKTSAGWWTAVGVDVKRGLETNGVTLKAPPAPLAPSAVLGRSFHCGLQLVYSSEDSDMTLTLRDIQIQPFMENTERFADAFDCIGYTTVPIWSGLMVTALLGIGFSISICMILDIKTMDRFETSRSKQLTITVSE